ncbi:MAG: galactose-1-phosphate uridylyltransferase [Pseudomonadota bacterium]
MSNADTRSTLAQTIGGAPVHRRTHRRVDGRNVHLYGYAPHVGVPAPQPPEELARGAELRLHPLRGEWNVYAAHRQHRTFKPSTADNPLAPTAPGGPVTEIPFETFELAVFENRFTSFHPEAPMPPERPAVRAVPAHGLCEVVVYGTEPTGNLHAIGQARRRLLLAAWIDRYEALFATGCEFVLPFENRGDAVGVTLPHPHGQVYGFAQTPRMSQLAASAFAEGYDLASARAQTAATYEVYSLDGVSAWCPPYARFPYETWVLPQRRVAGPWELNEQELDAFAALLGDMTARYDALFGEPTPYMMALHAAPKGQEATYHFTAQFYPILRAPGRLKYLASVEQHTGVFTVDVMPEQAAAALRALA